MRIITAGLTEGQRLEAVMKAARVDEHRARAMLDGREWDAVVVNGSVVVGPSVLDVAANRPPRSAAAGTLVTLDAHALYGVVRVIGGSRGTIHVTSADEESALVSG